MRSLFFCKIILSCTLLLPVVLPAQTSPPDLTTAQELRRQGKFTAALKELDDPKYSASREAELLRAKLFLDLDRLREAGGIYDALCPVVQSYDCWNSLGVVRMMLGGYSEAAEAFQKAVAANPGSAAGYSNLALAYQSAFQMAKAGEAHRRAVRLAPGDPIMHINYGAFLYRERKLDEAEELFDQLMRTHADLFYVRLYRGQIYLARRQYEQALRELDAGIQLNAKFFDLYYYRAVARYRLRDPGGALSDLQMADRLEPLNGKTRELRDIIQKKRR